MKLTENQKKAVSFLDGNALINAGSGAGKTSMLTARVANLIGNKRVEPNRILALTFTKEATQNMRDRLQSTIGDDAKDVHIYTFHSFAYRIMRSKFPSMYKNKTIMQGWWKTRKMYDIVGERTSNNSLGLGLNIRAGDLEQFISYQKSNMIKGNMNVIIDTEKFPFLEMETRENLQMAFNSYCEQVEYARLIEFDDMLVDFYYKLKENEVFLDSVKGSYDYILVDEFQDTNSINLEIIRLISENNLFVVGDFRQGVYGFINANIDNILDFADTFPNVETIELQENFRSTDSIVNFANDIIEVAPVPSYKKFGKQIPARGVEGESVKVNFYQNDLDETISIGRKIQEMVESEGYNYNDFAILYRTNAQLGIYESEFTHMEIPVDVSTSYSFFDRKEISDILSYALHSINPEDDMSMRKVINSPNRFISNAIVSEIDEYSYKNNMTFEEGCSHYESGKYKGRLDSFVSLFQNIREDMDMNASQFLKRIYSLTGYESFINKTAKTTSELDAKLDSIHRLFEISKRFSSVGSFLTHVEIVKQNGKKNDNGVKLMTAHGSKGLEFDHVFIPSVVMGNYPHDMNTDYEEERRLFYVACTRAKETMTLSIPIYSSDGNGLYEPSPFLTDMCEGDLLDKMNGGGDTQFVYRGLPSPSGVI